MFYVSIIDPEYFKETFDSFAVAFSSQLPSDQMDAFMNMESSMPTMGFVGNLIWCFVIGTIISSITASKLCGTKDPFED